MFTYIKKLTVFPLCSNTDSIQVMLRQAEKCSISLVEQFNITYDGKEPKRCRKRSIAKKRLLRKKFKRHYLCYNQKLASTQTLASAFLDRIRKFQNSKYESNLFKIIACFIDCHGSVHSDYVSFVMK